MRTKLLFILALVCGIAAAGGIYFYLDTLTQTYRVHGDFQTVVVAKQPIPARVPIDPLWVEAKEIPADYIHPLAIRKIEEVSGQITTGDIQPGEQVLSSRLATPENARNDLALAIQPNERAVALSVDSVSGVAGMLKAGDRIDLAVTLNDFTSTVLQNIRILAINMGQPAEGQQGPAPGTCVVAVTPQQAQLLILATERSSIRLMLRSASDNKVTEIPAARLEQLNR